MIRLRLTLALDYDIAEPGCDFIFNIHAAHTERQRVVQERLTLSQDVEHVQLQHLGTVVSSAPRIGIEAIAGADGRLVTPHHCTQALSTDDDVGGWDVPAGTPVPFSLSPAQDGRTGWTRC